MGPRRYLLIVTMVKKKWAAEKEWRLSYGMGREGLVGLGLFWALGVSVGLHYADLFHAVHCITQKLYRGSPEQTLLKEKPSQKQCLHTLEGFKALLRRSKGEICLATWLSQCRLRPHRQFPAPCFLLNFRALAEWLPEVPGPTVPCSGAATYLLWHSAVHYSDEDSFRWTKCHESSKGLEMGPRHLPRVVLWTKLLQPLFVLEVVIPSWQ